MRELIELKLPQMVEARKREEEYSPVDPSSPAATAHSHQLSQSSIMSDLPSPTFSSRGHSRMQSSTSSLPSSPTMLGSTEIFGSGKRPLTDVKEEPLERDEDFEMVDSFRYEEDLDYQGERPSAQCDAFFQTWCFVAMSCTDSSSRATISSTPFAPRMESRRSRSHALY